MPTFYLYRSNRKDKKYRLEMPSPHDHNHNFGARGMRDYTLINDKNSEFYLADRLRLLTSLGTNETKDLGVSIRQLN